jgi:Type II secretion system (T2SS), protein E, N-terminal domain
MPAFMNSGAPFLRRLRVKIDPRVPRLLPQPLVNEHKVVPISFATNRLTLAMTSPSNVVAFDDVRRVIKGVLIEPAAPRLPGTGPAAKPGAGASVDLLVVSVDI